MATVSGPNYDVKNPQVQQSSSNSANKPGQIGKDQFLQLMVTQLKYQDPLNPTDNQQFLAQMAQFSALEQMQNLNTSFTTSKALGLVGKYVEGTISQNGSSQDVKGDVESVRISGSNAYALINGIEVPMDSISMVKERSDMQKYVDLSKYTGIVGKNVKTVVNGIGQNEVSRVEGMVSSVSLVQGESGQIPIVLINGINTKIFSLDSTINIGTGTIKDYLQSRIGEIITSTVIDDLGVKAKMTGKVSAVSGDDTKPDVVFDEVGVALDSIYLVGE